MKRAVLLVALVALTTGLVAQREASAEVDFVLNAMPASLLINTEKTFAVIRDDGSRFALSSVYMMPNISAGVGFELGDFFIDVTGGAGIVVNETFRSFTLQALVAALYSVTDQLQIGPHGGLIHFPDPKWLQTDEMELDGATGWLFGLEIAMGDRIMYLASVDIISGGFDISKAEDVEPEQEQIDLMGLVVQFGVRGEF